MKIKQHLPDIERVKENLANYKGFLNSFAKEALEATREFFKNNPDVPLQSGPLTAQEEKELDEFLAEEDRKEEQSYNKGK